MKRNAILFSTLFTTLLVCSSCQKGKEIYIKFETTNCKADGPISFNSNNGYNAKLKIDYGYELSIDNITVINNGVIDNDCWTFMYQSNIENKFTIKPNTANGNIIVKVSPTVKKLHEYGCAIDVDAVNQKSIKFMPTQKEWKYIDDWQREAFLVMEDEKIQFTFSAKENEVLPTNIGMWMNGRYAKENVEVLFNYSDDKTSCEVNIPNFIIKDNIQFRLK